MGVEEYSAMEEAGAVGVDGMDLEEEVDLRSWEVSQTFGPFCHRKTNASPKDEPVTNGRLTHQGTTRISKVLLLLVVVVRTNVCKKMRKMAPSPRSTKDFHRDLPLSSQLPTLQ